MKIIENRKIWFSISSIIIIIGLVMGLARGLNLGIDFTGGTLMEIELHQQVEVSEIRQITNEYDRNASINLLGPDRTIIQMRSIEDFDSHTRAEIFNAFKEKYDLEENQPLRAEQFGPAIGKEIQNRAFLSVIISAIGMLIYITFRFELKFGLAAIVALLHDILIVLAVYSIFRVPVNSPFVAAMLTILGYSINDTIVVFDRIRENLRFIKKSNFAEVANNSIAQTISRSINTSVTTLITIVCLYIFGVEQIKVFALPLIAGVLSGTYSSIFIASPVWVMLKERKNKRVSYKPSHE
ncbi:protein translocase subunit SecF [Clostridium formicaceticum]|uniref:Protein-export membrane protein SecF n=1 Tax=Clostridium formicaceticum TaxID=1497 RepID=A0AAC9RKP3_9CLOT|nr:protein translocase subunit SecF [Clostridium formicaceticum]AOY76948.1 protein-export membrane protein SecF [Clostridium formicaceticum]ARE87429.1 preprotein translocase subunit SecF [Clostridium formicaceticum]